MKAKLGILYIALAATRAGAWLALAVAPADARTTRAASCGPKVSLMLWPKGYAAYPLPTFEVFTRGRPGRTARRTSSRYGSAAKDGAARLSRPRSVHSDCLDYGERGHALGGRRLGAKRTGALRLACSFPKAPTVTVKRLPATGQARAVGPRRPVPSSRRQW